MEKDWLLQEVENNMDMFDKLNEELQHETIFEKVKDYLKRFIPQCIK